MITCSLHYECAFYKGKKMVRPVSSIMDGNFLQRMPTGRGRRRRWRGPARLAPARSILRRSAAASDICHRRDQGTGHKATSKRQNRDKRIVPMSRKSGGVLLDKTLPHGIMKAQKGAAHGG